MTEENQEIKPEVEPVEEKKKPVEFDVKFEGTELHVTVKVDTNLDGEYSVQNTMIVSLGETADEVKDKFFA